MARHDLWDLFKTYFLTRRELSRLLVLALVFAFIVSFRTATHVSSLEEQLAVWVTSFIVVFIGVLIHDLGHHFVAYKRSLEPVLEISYYWLFFSILVMVLSRGYVQLFFGEKMFPKSLRVHRLGHFSYHEGRKDLGYVALAGPFVSMVLGAVCVALSVYFDSSILLPELAKFSFAYALMTFLPLPHLDGLLFFFHSRSGYALIFGAILGFGVFATAGISIFGASVLSIIMAFMFWYVFAFMVEK